MLTQAARALGKSALWHFSCVIHPCVRFCRALEGREGRAVPRAAAPVARDCRGVVYGEERQWCSVIVIFDDGFGCRIQESAEGYCLFLLCHSLGHLLHHCWNRAREADEGHPAGRKVAHASPCISSHNRTSSCCESHTSANFSSSAAGWPRSTRRTTA